MDQRKISVLAGLLLLIGSIPLAYYLSSGNNLQESNNDTVNAVNVPVSQYSPEKITAKINFTGRVIPLERVDIASEVTGRLEEGPKRFKSGIIYKKGEPLLTINDSETREQLKAQKYEFSALLSRILPDIDLDYSFAYDKWKNYLENYDAGTPIETLPETNDRQLELFLNSNNVFSSYHSIKQLEERLDKYSIEAPFNGAITESRVDPGAMIQPNQVLGEFIRLNPLEIEASIPANQIKYVNEGDSVKLRLSGNQKSYKPIVARIDRINDKINRNTQSVTVYMQINDSSFKSGSYVEGTIDGNTFENVHKVSSDALVRDNSVFEIVDSTAVMREINILAHSGDSLIINGLDSGALIIDEFRNASFEGTKTAPIATQ